MMTFEESDFGGTWRGRSHGRGRTDRRNHVGGRQSGGPAAPPVVPAFYNCHTHLAMNLLRGYADDRALMPWLRDYVWPAEARLTEEIVYAGARLAILELIRSGTVFANDMYWHAPMVARAAEEMGIRCAVSMQTVETGGPGVDDPRNVAANAALADLPREASSRVFTTLAPHAVYTVCEATLRRLADRARAEDRFVHIHVAETQGRWRAAGRNMGAARPSAICSTAASLARRR